VHRVTKGPALLAGPVLAGPVLAGPVLAGLMRTTGTEAVLRFAFAEAAAARDAAARGGDQACRGR
jgi:hypothetical protein